MKCSKKCTRVIAATLAVLTCAASTGIVASADFNPADLLNMSQTDINSLIQNAVNAVSQLDDSSADGDDLVSADDDDIGIDLEKIAADTLNAVAGSDSYASMTQEDLDKLVIDAVNSALASAKQDGNAVATSQSQDNDSSAPFSITVQSPQEYCAYINAKYPDVLQLTYENNSYAFRFLSACHLTTSEQEALVDKIMDEAPARGNGIKHWTTVYARDYSLYENDTDDVKALKSYILSQMKAFLDRNPSLSSLMSGLVGDVTDEELLVSVDNLYEQMTEKRTKTITNADIDAYFAQLDSYAGTMSDYAEQFADPSKIGQPAEMTFDQDYTGEISSDTTVALWHSVLDDYELGNIPCTYDYNEETLTDYPRTLLDDFNSAVKYVENPKYSFTKQGALDYANDIAKVATAIDHVIRTADDKYEIIGYYYAMHGNNLAVVILQGNATPVDEELRNKIFEQTYNTPMNLSTVRSYRQSIDFDLAPSDADETEDDTAVQSEEGNVLVIRCWNEAFKTIFENTMPGYEDGKLDGVTVEWLFDPSDDGVYMNKLDAALANNATADEWDKVDLFLVEPDNAVKYANSEVSLPISDLGVKLSSEQFDCANDMLKDSEGNQKGVMYAFDPGVLIYRRSIAKDVLGTDDPQEVQQYLSDWSSFEAVADEAKKKGYRMLASQEDLYRPMTANKDSEWVVNGELQVPESAIDWINTAINFTKEDYTWTSDFWGDAKNRQMFADGKTMCFFGPQWYYTWCMGNAQDPDIGCFGDWAICEGPASYIYGGTGLVAATGTDNPTLVAKIMQTYISDVDTILAALDDQYIYNCTFFNNRTAMKKLASDANYGNAFLGGQNEYTVLLSAADYADYETWNNATIYDTFINDTLVKYIMQNFTNTNTPILDSCNRFLDEFITAFPNIDATNARATFEASFGTPSQSEVTTTGSTWVEVEDIDAMVELQHDSSGKTTEPVTITVQNTQQTKWEDAPKTVETDLADFAPLLIVLSLVGAGTTGTILYIRKRK